ncbi:ankyrin repeat domain-containing protein 29 [Nannizzia gypsea CBS 118893]|uniref:Ankyrin repeat domain-containing protein 29 n=1 Tax=Arthroderma gypseum (strain ATCC MYA-4604 / CBS 118893) TaxID=535722 RepID=E4UY61_ARTGP|nr:ankyrin repeat domain-containing protein 29 [Nannizzia gypsea CBS 118893]EFR02841.1 ankyrin repeat domain-containing protein 29 [Nannizzia gypsea CBS 118893]
MEAAASVVGLIQVTTHVLHLTVKFYFEVRDARKEIKWLEGEVSDLQGTLRKILDLVEDTSDPKAIERLPAFALLLGEDGALARCQAELLELAGKLEKAGGLGSGKHEVAQQKKNPMRQFGVRALKWPFTGKEIKSSIAVLERCKASFNLALSADQTRLTLDTNRLVVELGKDISANHNEQQKGEYRAKIIQWLSAVEQGVSWSNHEDARKKHSQGTGEWALELQAFKEWKSAGPAVLWMHGKPGSGKTVLSSSVIEHLQAEYDTEPGILLSYFYFDFGTPAKQSATNCLRYLLSRLLTKAPEVPQELRDLYVKKCNFGSETPALSDLTAIFKLFAESEVIENIFIAIDALDECPLENRQELLDFLQTITSWTPSNLHLFLTSRAETDIKEVLCLIPIVTEVSVGGSSVTRDITHHIQTQLSSDPALKKLPAKLKSEIQDKLIADADGMFRWVDCQLNELKRCKTKALLIKTLDSLPKTLDGTYERILQSIPENYQDYARRALWWLVEARRPLSSEEVAEAAILDADDDTPFDPEGRFFNPQDDILEILGSLVSVAQREHDVTGMDDGNDSRVTATTVNEGFVELRLSHFSVKEYLISTHPLNCQNPLVVKFYVDKSLVTSFILRSCLQYVTHYIDSDCRVGTKDDIDEFPLLLYVCEFWFAYTGMPLEDKAVELLNEFFMSESQVQAWLLVYTPNQPKKDLFQPPDEPGQALHYASYLGLTGTAKHLIENGATVNCTTTSGVTPLIRAAERGRVEVVNLLIQFDPEVDRSTKGGRTPLQVACSHGHIKIVESLLSANADIESKDVDLWTPLYWAAEGRHEDIVNLLLKRGADPNARTMSGGTALHQVCGRGYYEIAQRLLDAGAEANLATSWGRTPLHQAAAAGSLEVVKLLLAHGADPNVLDKSYSSPVSLAEENLHGEILDVLRPLTNLKDPLDSSEE